jgi:plasmid stabilization system protein ParE
MTVIWSEKADETFGVIADYLETTFGKTTTLRFIKKSR